MQTKKHLFLLCFRLLCIVSLRISKTLLFQGLLTHTEPGVFCPVFALFRPVLPYICRHRGMYKTPLRQLYIHLVPEKYAKFSYSSARYSCKIYLGLRLVSI